MKLVDERLSLGGGFRGQSYLRMGNRPPLVVSWGGGVNSTAMLIGFFERGIRPDLILFADTGGEKPVTYWYLLQFSRWLAEHDFPALQIVRYQHERYRTLEENCLVNATLPGLAFGFSSCSVKWKIEPQNRYVKHWQPAQDCWEQGDRVVKAIGFDADEERRAKIDGDDQYLYWYPLIDWQWGREECIETIQRAGLPVPPKSACFFCPSSKKAEVLALKRESPDLYQRAVALERNAKATCHTVQGLGRRWSWDDLGHADEMQLKLFPDSDAMPCGCFDGTDDEDETTEIRYAVELAA